MSLLRTHPLAPLPVLALLLLGAGTAPQEVRDEEWPKAIDLPEGRVVMYQPEPESFEGDDLSGRAAVSVQLADAEQPVFGVVWMTARVSTDRDERTVSVLDIDVTDVRFPNTAEEERSALAAILEAQVPRWDLTFSLDRLLTSLDLAEREMEAAERFSGTPPDVIVRREPTILVLIDGDPILESAGDAGVMRVVNTPFTVLLAEGAYYLFAGDDRWYRAGALDGDWTLTEDVPAAVDALEPQMPEDVLEADPEQEAAEPGPPPAIIVATGPTELIVTEGEPQYSPITGTDLLYVTNSESDVLLEVATQRHLIVLSGRWYAAPGLDGPWTHLPPDDLPATLADIPDDSEMAHLLISVPGTEAAREAVLDQQIPQTAAIRRDQATLTVEYDGDPWFEPIPDTPMEYAINTDVEVIKAQGKYWAVSEAVWFVADAPTGPWIVADDIPEEIYGIPPEVPVHNVTYVRVYDSTPDVVYVGYYPGYMHSYVYYGTVVYGTGYWYRPWYGSVYYPRPVTYGFHVRYNPWYGWSFGFSYATGPFTFAMGWGGPYRYYPGWWGPMGYRGYWAGYHRGWHAGYRAGAWAGYRAGTRAAYARNNIYDRPANRPRNVERPATADRIRPDRAADGRNNVFSDRDGNVYRRGEDGWDRRTPDGWRPDAGAGAGARPGQQPERPGTRPAQPQTRPAPGARPTQPSTRPAQPGARPSQPSTRPAQPGTRPNLDRSQQSRDRGAARARDFQRTRPAPRGGGRRPGR